MERVNLRLLGFCAIMLAGMGGIYLTRPKKTFRIDERWMENKLPMAVGQFAFLPGAANPKQSYKMDDRTYKLLQPYGIVARTFSHGNESYDAVVIASDNKESFHDPQVCFSAQGFTFTELGDVIVDTQHDGKVPVKVVSLRRQGAPNQVAAYTYKGPGGFFASINKMKMAMILEPLKGGFDIEGVFYRFIPNEPGGSREDLLRFIGQYLDAAHESSAGFF